MPFCSECVKFQTGEDKLGKCGRMLVYVKANDFSCNYFKRGNASDYAIWTCPHCKKEYKTYIKETFASCPRCRLKFVLKDVVKNG